MRHLLFGLLPVVLVGVAANPASPAPLSLTLTLQASPAAYSGPCPVTVKFAGTIAGASGTSVTYHFAHTLGKITTPTSPVNATIPGNGVLPVNDALVIDSMHAGAQTDELDEGWTNKAVAPFTVTCVLPPPSPSPKPTAAPTPRRFTFGPAVIQAAPTPTPVPKIKFNPAMTQLFITAPAGLTNTTDPSVCEAHFAPGFPFVATLCAAAIQQPLLILVWNWSPGCASCPQADGYNVYRVDHGRHDYLGSQTPGSSTEYGPELPPDGFSGKCYAVTAFAGKQESADSPGWCLNGRLSSGTVTVTLQPQHTGFDNRLTHHRSGICNQTDGKNEGGTALLSIGWQYYEEENPICNHHYSWYTRGAAVFDLSGVTTKIWKATLNIGDYFTNWYGPVPNGQPRPATFANRNRYSCIDHLGLATGVWWDNLNNWIDAQPYTDWAAWTMPATIDVTQQVRSWKLGAPNYGFVFRPDKEGDQNDATAQEGCWTTIVTVSLTIEYFP